MTTTAVPSAEPNQAFMGSVGRIKSREDRIGQRGEGGHQDSELLAHLEVGAQSPEALLPSAGASTK